MGTRPKTDIFSRSALSGLKGMIWPRAGDHRSAYTRKIMAGPTVNNMYCREGGYFVTLKNEQTVSMGMGWKLQCMASP